MRRLIDYLAPREEPAFKWHKLIALSCMLVSIVIALLAIYWLLSVLLREFSGSIPTVVKLLS